MNLGDIFEKDYYFEFELRKNYETGKVAHKLPRGTNEPLRFTIEEMYLLRQFFKEYGSDALFDELYEFNEDLYLDNAEILSTCTGGYDRILSCKLNADSAIP